MSAGRRVPSTLDRLTLLGEDGLLCQIGLDAVKIAVLCGDDDPLGIPPRSLPDRSRALTAPAPCVLRYACQVRLPAPRAVASVWQCLSAPATPPRFPPIPNPPLVTKSSSDSADEGDVRTEQHQDDCTYDGTLPIGSLFRLHSRLLKKSSLLTSKFSTSDFRCWLLQATG